MKLLMRHILGLILLGLAFIGTTYGQVSPIPFLKPQWFTNTGAPCAGCFLGTFIAGTSTPLATYADALGVTVNPNPVPLDSTGRANVFLGSSAYKFVLTTPASVTIWTEDNITASNLSLLASNNTWTGTNTWSAASTFNGTATFGVGLTSNGPTNLTTGGSLSGTFTGSPTLSGTPNFSNGFMATTGSFSGQITSTVSTGTAPFIVASTTNVGNLNSSFLNGNTFASPGAIGGTTPGAGTFTTLVANTSLAINGSTAQTGVQGTDTKLASAGTLSTTPGTGVCTDSNGGVTTTGCSSAHLISLGTNSSVCSTTTGAGNECSTSVSISPNQPDTLYIATCSGITPTGYPFIIGLSKATGSITVTISNGTASQAVVSTVAELDCQATHP